MSAVISCTNLQHQPTKTLNREMSVNQGSRIPIQDSNEAIDKTSISGQFGWMMLDGANIPCLFRSGEKYVSVRMVEQKLLSRYPNTYPDELRHRAPLTSQFVTIAEAKLLNEINVEHCACEFGQQAFTERDLIVRWTDFLEFYKIVKKHFPSEVPSANQNSPSEPVCMGGGWVQVNNTVVPYVRRLAPSGKETLRLAPLPVIRYAANLLVNAHVPTLDPTEDECKMLTNMCRSAGLAFTFSSGSTPLILLSLLPVHCDTKVSIKRLPDNDPFSGAEYSLEFEGLATDGSPGNHVSLPTTRVVSASSEVMPPSGAMHRTITSCSTVTATNHFHQRWNTVPVSTVSVGGQPQGSKVTVDGDGPPAKMPKQQVNVPMTRPVSVSSGPPPQLPTSIVSRVEPQSFMVPAVGMMPGAQGAWSPQINNPADMKKLADMMNIQAAILSQTGIMTTRGSLLQHPFTKDFLKMTNLQVNQNVTQHNPTLEALKIKPVDFYGKKVSCLVKEGSRQQFALVEAISRVYFPYCNLDEFLHTLSEVLHISVYQLNRQEEQAFINFYGLPTMTLKCNKVLNLMDLDPFMVQLKSVFDRAARNLQVGPSLTSHPKDETSGAETRLSRSTLAIKDKELFGADKRQNVTVFEKCKVSHGSSDVLQPMNFSLGSQSAIACGSSAGTNSNSLISEQVTEHANCVMHINPGTTHRVPQSVFEKGSHQKVDGVMNGGKKESLCATRTTKSSRKSYGKCKSAGLAKLSKLEDTVNRLHQNRMKEFGPCLGEEVSSHTAAMDKQDKAIGIQYTTATMTSVPVQKTMPLLYTQTVALEDAGNMALDTRVAAENTTSSLDATKVAVESTRPVIDATVVVENTVTPVVETTTVTLKNTTTPVVETATVTVKNTTTPVVETTTVTVKNNTTPVVEKITLTDKNTTTPVVETTTLTDKNTTTPVVDTTTVAFRNTTPSLIDATTGVFENTTTVATETTTPVLDATVAVQNTTTSVLATTVAVKNTTAVSDTTTLTAENITVSAVPISRA